MRTTFHHRLVNDPFEDPVLYVRLLWQRRSVLMDSGDIGLLGSGDIMKISDIFVTHTHIDHFIGFDRVIRMLLRRDAPLSVYGPAEIIDRVQGKLMGYTWNVIEDYPLKIEVYGVDGGTLRHSSFHAESRFERRDEEPRPFDGVLLDEGAFRVRAAALEHDISCLAYSIQEDVHINIDKAALGGMCLPVGPWLSEFKEAIRQGSPDDTEFHIGGGSRTLGELRHIALITRGQKVSYVTDVSPTGSNIERIIGLARDSDTLYCEAYFLDEDRDRAVERSHLTAKIAGSIAREANVKSLVPIHFSPKYRNTEYTPLEEALEEFRKAS